MCNTGLLRDRDFCRFLLDSATEGVVFDKQKFWLGLVWVVFSAWFIGVLF